MLWGSCFLLINILTFFLFGEDKKRAIEKKRRISERTLLLFSFFGGALGALLGMRVFHHKTRKMKFRVSVPLFLILQIIFLLKILRISFVFPC